MRLELEPAIWRLEALAPGFWGLPTVLTIGPGENRTTIQLWPASKLAGQLRADPTDNITELVAHFKAAPGFASPQAMPESDVICPLRNQEWQCELPAGKLDIRFQLAGYIDQYRWGLLALPQQRTSAGTLEFRRGSAISGWVVTEQDSPENAAVILRARTFVPPVAPTDRERLQLMTQTTKVNDRGFFHLDAVPPGEYVIEVSKKPFATARASVAVAANATTEVADPPLMLRYPQKFEIVVEPPVAPGGEPWQITLKQLDHSSTTLAVLAQSRVPVDGAWRHDEVSPGRYRVELAQGATSWWAEEIELEGNLSPHFVKMSVVEIRGAVSLGKAPLPAELWFGGEDGLISIPFSSDEEGRFAGHLPHSGRWEVDVRAQLQPLERRLKIEVVPRSGKSYAELELKLPNTMLEGEVVDELGRGVHAMVTAQGLDDLAWPTRKKTEEGGKFAIAGLPPGLTRVIAESHAENENYYSDEVEAKLAEGIALPRLRLVLKRQLKLTGRVTAHGRGVARARIKAQGVPLFGLLVYLKSSDAEGRFEAGVPAGAQEILLTVAAPGFSLRMLRLPASAAGTELEIPLEEAGGTLVIEWPDLEIHEGDGNAPQIFLLHGGAFEGLGYFHFWSQFHGVTTAEKQRRTLPRMEPGEYAACAVPVAQVFTLLAGAVQAPCARGSLTASGELVLRVPQRGRTTE